MKYLINDKSLFTLYNTLILPYITYCNIIWANCSKMKINSIVLLQKRAIRICTHSNYLANSNPLFSQLKTLKVYDIHTLQTAIFMYKYTSKTLPASFLNFYLLNVNVHSYLTRHAHDYHLNNPKLSLALRSIRHHGPDIWNNLPNHIKIRTSLYSFKANMKTYLLTQYSLLDLT